MSIDETDVHDTPTLGSYDYLKWHQDFKGHPEPADAWQEAVERAGKIFNQYQNEIAGLVQENALLKDALRNMVIRTRQAAQHNQAEALSVRAARLEAMKLLKEMEE
jgi:hypothetical protein